MVEIAIDEWFVEYVSPASDSIQIQLALTFAKLVKVKCDKMIFTPEHFKRLLHKVEKFKRDINDRFVYPRVLMPLTELLYDSNKAEVRAGYHPSNVGGVKNDDFPIIDSASAIMSRPRVIITTDADLVKAITDNPDLNHLQCLSPEEYIGKSLIQNEPTRPKWT